MDGISVSRIATQDQVVNGPGDSPSIAFPWPEAGDKATRHSVYEEYAELKASVGAHRSRARKVRRDWTWLDYMGYVLPCINWLRTYKIREYLMFDIMSGVAVAFTLVPQGMSYAGIAGLPAVYGLYGGFTPLLVYAAFGSCRQLGVGPVAVTSTLIGSGLAGLAPDVDDPNNLTTPEQQQEQATYNVAVIQLAFLVSCMYTAVGVLRLGWVIRFLSHAVITGFTSGAAIIIATGQLKYIFGVSYKKQETLQGELSQLIDQLEAGNFQWQEFVMGSCMIVLLVALRYVGTRWPKAQICKALAPFIACVVGIVVVVTTGSSAGNGPIKIVKKIPSGMPPVTIGQWIPVQNLGTLLPLAFLVMAVDLLESTSIARALARKNNYQLAFNQEIVALGIANFFGAAFSAYTTTGSFSRSAINNSTGAKTQLAGFVTGIIVMFVLLFLTQVFRLMPYNTMAAIIIVGVLQLVELGVAIELFRVHVRDFVVWAVAFLCTLFLGVELGLLCAIALSLLIIIFESAFPHTATLGRLPRTTAYRSLENFPNSEVIPGILVMRLDAPLWFANSMHFEEKMDEYIDDAGELSRQHGVDRIFFVVLEMNAMTFMDSQGAHTILAVADRLQQRGVQLLLSNPNRRVARILDRMHMEKSLPRNMVFSRAYEAVGYCRAELAKMDDGEGAGEGKVVIVSPPSEGSGSEPDTPAGGVALQMGSDGGKRRHD